MHKNFRFKTKSLLDGIPTNNDSDNNIWRNSTLVLQMRGTFPQKIFNDLRRSFAAMRRGQPAVSTPASAISFCWRFPNRVVTPFTPFSTVLSWNLSCVCGPKLTACCLTGSDAAVRVRALTQRRPATAAVATTYFWSRLGSVVISASVSQWEDFQNFSGFLFSST